MSDAVLRYTGVKEGSTTWQAVKYLEARGHPLAAAVRAYSIPMARLEPAVVRYRAALQMRSEEAREVWVMAQSMTADDFQRWWVERDHK